MGESLIFEVSLFGEAQRYLPYLVMVVGEMGVKQGLGQTIHGGQRGKFHLVQLEAVDPFCRAEEVLMREGETEVRWPTLQITEASVLAEAERLAARQENSLTLRFLTPMRLIVGGKLVKQPEFGPFFHRLLERWSALRQQFADQPPLDKETWDRLISLAESVALVKNECQWHEVRGHSTRLDRAQELGGLMGTATYLPPRSGTWRELLLYLLWGQVMQVGKNTVKGAGVYQLEIKN